MIRTIHPVGQGGFISEKFVLSSTEEKIIVYDCGSLSGKSLVEQEIRNSFHNGERINSVFISHLDNDHVNGLQYLIEYCNVENVFLPYLTPKALLMALIKYKCQEESGQEGISLYFTTELIFYAREQSPVYFKNNGEEFNDNFPKIHFVNHGNVSMQNVHICNINIWEYLTFNNENINKINDFFNYLSVEGIPKELLKNTDNFESLWGNISYRNILKKIYKKMEGGINANSLGVISYPIVDAYKSSKHCVCFSKKCNIDSCYSNINKYNVGAVYVGDMDLSDEHSDFYKYRYKGRNVGLLQLPHHGSKNNYNSKCSDDFYICIANAGYSNPYGHPSTIVFNDLINKNIVHHTVTDQTGSRYREYIVIEL